MRIQKALAILLLAVQVPLLNLGPSLHRLPCFDLHVESHSGCCHGICCESVDKPNEWAEALVETNAIDPSSEHDCFFCRFLEQYHGLDESRVCSQRCEIRRFVRFDEYDRVSAHQIRGIARGPPALI